MLCMIRNSSDFRKEEYVQCTESHPESRALPDDKEFIEKSMDENSRSNNGIRTVIPQKHSNVVECESILTSIDKYENNLVPTIEKADEENDEYEDDNTISIIDKETRNNSKEEKSYICFGNIGYVVEKAFKLKKGSSEDLKQPKSKRVLSLLDTLISTSIVGPLTIGFWRGVWASMDHHAELFPSWFCFTFGAVLHATYTIFKDQFHNIYMKKWTKLNWRKRLPYRALRVLYTYTFGIACIAHWRGGWIIIDNYLFMHMWITTSLTCSLLACLAILRSVRNLIATPFVTLIDTPSRAFKFPTRYNVGAKPCVMTNGTTTKFDSDWVRMVELRAAGARMTGSLDTRSSNRLHYAILTILDTIFSALMVAPAVVGYWRGTWGLSDFYVYSNEPVFSSFASITVGFTGLFAFNVLQHGLDDVLHPDKHRLCYYLGSRFYTGIFGFCCVNAWRGAWKALDIYTELTPGTVSATTIVSLLALGIMRAVRNVSAPPFSLILDSCPGYFEVQTMFRVNNTRDWSLYLLDCAFSVGIVGTLVVFVWRGVWTLIDIYLFPENPEYSAVGSLAVGYFIVAVTFCLQPLMRYICARLQGLVRLMIADAFLLLSFLGTVNVWRGIWNALDLWLLPDNLELSCWITHVGCFVFLVLLNCSNSILVRGVYIDAEEEEGQCVVFPCHYLRLFFKIEREKKQARQQKLLVASQDFIGHTDVNEKDGENGTLLPNNTTMSIIPVNADSLA